MGIKLRTINANELRLSTHRDATCAAHTRTVNHDRIERGFGGDVVPLRSERHELHHDCGTDSDALIDLFALSDHLYALGDATFRTG